MAYGLGTGVGIDPTIATAMDQAFAADHEAMGGVRESAVAGDKLVAELIRNAAARIPTSTASPRRRRRP